MSYDQGSLFHPMLKEIKGVIWQTEGSTLLARQDDVVFSKKTAERYLFRTERGQYFEQCHHAGLGKKNTLKSSEIIPLTAEEALKRYMTFTWKYLPPAQAFPDAQHA